VIVFRLRMIKLGKLFLPNSWTIYDSVSPASLSLGVGNMYVFICPAITFCSTNDPPIDGF
jgi:hypothetical protein